MLWIRQKSEYDALSPRERSLIKAAAKAHAFYRDRVEDLRALNETAALFRGVPFLGRWLARWHDKLRFELPEHWYDFLRHVDDASEAISRDTQFADFAIERLRTDVDTVWPLPRPIDLPSDGGADE